MNKSLYSALLISFIIFLIIPLNSAAQSANNNQQQQQQQNNQTRFQFQSIDGESQYFVDQIGLHFLADYVPSKDYFDDVNYVIGPQDVLSVNIQGPVSLHARALVINSNGYLYMPYAGSVSLSGLTISEAKAVLEEAVSEELNDFELTLNVQKPRPVEVQVLGNIPHPGRYLVPAGTRLDQAVYAALFEGQIPSKGDSAQNYQQEFLGANNYSLRDITIDRKSTTGTDTGDLISYLKIGEQTSNPYLYDGDQVSIKTLNENSPRISVSGAVQSQQEIEYRKDDTIESLLSLSGGFIDGADTTRAILYREDSDGITQRSDLQLNNKTLSSHTLMPNDRLVIPYREDISRSASAWIYGEAIIPGNFPIESDETTLAELLDLAGGLTDQALPNGAYLIRSNMSDRNVPSATTINTQQLLRTSDQVRQGFDYLEMEQQLNSDQRMFIDLEDQQQLEQTRVTDGDRLYIPKDYQNIVLYGQLNNPGNYPYNSSLSVQDYIQRAGGMSLAANPDRVFIIKAGSRAWKLPSDTALESGDMIYVDRTPFDELNAQRNYDIQRRNLRQGNLQLILTTVSTITAVVTTYVAITR